MKLQLFRVLVVLGGTLVLLLGVPYLGQAAPPDQEPSPAFSDEILPQQPGPTAKSQPQPNRSFRGLSTPELIEAALSRGEIDQDTANLYLAYALGDYQQLPAQYRSNVPWDGTLPLFKLQQAVKTMKVSPKRAKIIEILSGSCSSSTGTLPNIYNSAHFHIEYGTIGGGLIINDYATSLDTAWTTEVTSFGWAAPPVLSSNPPPLNRYHVRIDSLGSSLYGYVSNVGDHAGFVGNNPNTAWDDVDAYASCMVLNRDYSGFPGSPQQALDATTAHEFNHSIQFGYGALTGANEPDTNFVEGGATWMEDEVFDSANDNYNYLWPDFSMCMGEYTASPYPYWITWRGLTERYGTSTAGAGEQVMQDFWEETSKSSTSNMFSAINTALVNKGTNLADAYHAYAIAVKFNKPCSGGYVYPYCFEEGASYVFAAGPTPLNGTIVTPGSNYSGSIADNYALNWISLPSTGIYTVTLQNTSGGGQLRGSVVCDTGSALNVNALPSLVGAGSSSSLPSFNPSGCSSVVAVVTNQAQTASNPSTCAARSYMLRTDGGTGSSYNIYLPLILKESPCLPIGESNNIADALTVSSGQTVCGQVSNPTDLDDVYKILIADGQTLTIVMSGNGGDADLYLYYPDATDVNTDIPAAWSATDGNDEFIQGTVSGGTAYWYIDVYAYSGTTNYQVTATLSGPGTTETRTFYFTGGANQNKEGFDKNKPKTVD